MVSLQKYLCLIALFILVACQQTQEMTIRDFAEQNIDFDWYFHLGNIENAQTADYDHSQWRKLDLPHDFSIEQGFDVNHEGGWQAGYTKGGIGWYRKSITWQPGWENKKVYIRFDGIYMNSDVWINGHHLGHRPYGYISFYYDLTPYLQEGENIIAVRADNQKIPSSRWYTGSGIYRHVWLRVTNPIHIANWGTQVTTPQVSREKATIMAEITINNDTENARMVTLENLVLNNQGQPVASQQAEITLPGKSNHPVQLQFSLNNPDLWSPDQPKVYQLESRIIRDKQLVDRNVTTFGIRTVSVSAQRGFQLNGETLKLKGLCNHHDAGAVGSAVPDEVLYYRLKLLKEMGSNAIRTAHNPAAPELYAICDTLGLMVMDEPFDGWEEPKAEYDYGNYFNEWWQKDLQDFLKRDRNHPSIVMWSVGNEVHGYTDSTQKKLVDFVHQYDTTRPITQARGYMGPYVDVAGFNGHGEEKGYMAGFHGKNPQKPIVGTEITHTLQTRGVYQSLTKYRKRDFPAIWELGSAWEPFQPKVHKIPDLTKTEVFDSIPYAYQSSYDNAIVRMGVRDTEKMIRANDYFMGSFRWTGFDYLGEATIQPARTANFGIIDLAGFPKDHYYLYQSLWTDKPMVHLLPHWTHPGKEGVEIPVVVYTNLPKAELFLNGQSLGEKVMTDDLQLVWLVPYQPGSLKVVASDETGFGVEKSVYTAGKAAKIALLPHKVSMQANNRDVIRVEVNVTDASGNLVPEANQLIRFEITGPARNLGVENGDILDFSPVKAYQRKAFNGKCMIVLQSTFDKGSIYLKATARDLKTETLKLTSL